ncbi:hypothetical protein niasHT_035304 [Heterodera trifolii]|uniref:Uncharacterized protein n=1 Tax=Heterodera trifolii TaxID=157864 RepID=A0ABD2IA48_9BILA
MVITQQQTNDDGERRHCREHGTPSQGTNTAQSSQRNSNKQQPSFNCTVFIKAQQIPKCFKMNQKLFLITLFGVIALLALIDAIGLPQQNQCCQQQQCCQGGCSSGCCGGGGGGCCCCQGGGGGGGLGGLLGRRRRRRGVKELGQVSAIQPHYKAVETPCPQTAWQETLEKSILAGDAIGSVSAIQSGLYARFGQKFLVTCADANETKEGQSVPNRVHFSSSGDGYCNMVKEKVWCQAVAVVA